jgi:hypothetical protein
MLVEQFLRDRAWWRLDGAGPNAVHVARSVVSLLDAAAYLRDVPDDAPDLLALEAAGCFRGGIFDPGPEGAVVVRDWRLAGEIIAGPADLLAALVRAAHQPRPGTAGPGTAGPGTVGPGTAGAIPPPRPAAEPATPPGPNLRWSPTAR